MRCPGDVPPRLGHVVRSEEGLGGEGRPYLLRGVRTPGRAVCQNLGNGLSDLVVADVVAREAGPAGWAAPGGPKDVGSRVSIGWVDLDGVVNMRDVGGLPTADGRSVRTGRLLRSDNLQDLTERDIRRLIDDYGVHRHRRPAQQRRVPRRGARPAVRDAAHPPPPLALPRRRGRGDRGDALVLPWQDEATKERLRSHDDDYWASHYLGYLADRPDSVSGALRVVASSPGATVVHCAAGKDRTGTVVGMALAVAGVPDEEIVADYVATAERIERIIERLISRPAYADNLRGRPIEDHLPRPETMARILQVLDERFGGVAGWLVAQGWTEEETEALRSRLVG